MAWSKHVRHMTRCCQGETSCIHSVHGLPKERAASHMAYMPSSCIGSRVSAWGYIRLPRPTLKLSTSSQTGATIRGGHRA
eukprot:scaffold28332_cov138-Isochrysis_galbana.AAC.4